MTLPFPDDWISAWLDDELVGEDRARFEAELEENAALREQVEGLRKVGDRLRDMPTHRLPPDFAAHVAALAMGTRAATGKTESRPAAAPLTPASPVDLSQADGGAASESDGATGTGRRRGGWYAAISIIGSLAALLLVSLSISGPLSRTFERSVAFGTTEAAPASAPKLATGGERGFDAPAAPTMAAPLAPSADRADTSLADRDLELKMQPADGNASRAVEATGAAAPDLVESGMSRSESVDARGQAVRATDPASLAALASDDASAMPLGAMGSGGGPLGNGPVTPGHHDLALGLDRSGYGGGFGGGGAFGFGGMTGGGMGGGMGGGGMPEEGRFDSEALADAEARMYFVDPLLRSNLSGGSRRQRTSGIADEPSDPSMIEAIARSTEGSAGAAPPAEAIPSGSEPNEAEGERRIASARGGANAPAVPAPAGGPVRGAAEPNGVTPGASAPAENFGGGPGGIPGGGRDGLAPGGLGGLPLLGGAGGVGRPDGLGYSNDSSEPPGDSADPSASIASRFLERGGLAVDDRFHKDNQFYGHDVRPIEALWIVVLDDAQFERVEAGESPIVRLIKSSSLDEVGADVIAPADEADLRMLEVVDSPERIGDLYSALEADWKVATYRIELSRLDRDDFDRFGRFDIEGETAIAEAPVADSAPEADAASDAEAPNDTDMPELLEVDRVESEYENAQEELAQEVVIESEVRENSEEARETPHADSLAPLHESGSWEYRARFLSESETSWFGLLSIAEDLSRPESERLAGRRLEFGDEWEDRSDVPPSEANDVEKLGEATGTDGTPSIAARPFRFRLLDDAERLARTSSETNELAEIGQTTGRRSRLLIVLRRSPTAERSSGDAVPAAPAEPIDDSPSAPPPASSDRDD